MSSLPAAGLAACWWFHSACGAGAEPLTVKAATFNVALNRPKAGALAAELERGSPQAEAVAAIIRRIRPDVLLLNEFDHDPAEKALTLFRERYLAGGKEGESLRYEHAFVAPVNTGEPSRKDLDRDGRTDGPGDAFGFGRFPGQYGMVLLSRFPIDARGVRTFRNFLWKDMPGARLPDDPATPAPGDWYSADVLAVLRLSSKSHWDVPLRIGDRTLHVLACHPTPPVFDGPEDRNGRRNADEIRLWADYVEPARAGYLVDDAGGRGGLPADASFVILGDLNSDPHDGDAVGAIKQLLDHPRVRNHAPAGPGGVEQAERQGKTNLAHRGDPAHDTGDFDEPPGNLRLDYVLFSRDFAVRRSGIFWPRSDDPDFKSVGGGGKVVSSDHRLVWCEAELRDAPP